MKTSLLIVPTLVAIAILTGCTSTQKRAAVVTGGAAAGAGAGYALSDGDPLATAAGAVVGGGAVALAQGEDKAVFQKGFDDGYVQGSADAVKRLYWAKQDLEKKGKGEGDNSGVLRYYVWEEEGTTPDGRKLAPEKVAVPVYEPLPKK